MTKNSTSPTETEDQDQLFRLIRSALDRVEQTGDQAFDVLYQELKTMSATIESVRDEIGVMRPLDIQDKQIPSVTDELDAVVNATESATTVILDACELIQMELDKMEASVAETVEEEVTRVLEACSFQDITGQRVTKVIKTLQSVEEKISLLLKVMESRISDFPKSSPDAEEEQPLANGPQLPEQGISQEDIDKILAEFD